MKKKTVKQTELVSRGRAATMVLDEKEDEGITPTYEYYYMYAPLDGSVQYLFI